MNKRFVKQWIIGVVLWFFFIGRYLLVKARDCKQWIIRMMIWLWTTGKSLFLRIRNAGRKYSSQIRASICLILILTYLVLGIYHDVTRRRTSRNLTEIEKIHELNEQVDRTKKIIERPITYFLFPFFFD